jgi:hypothetical protein
MLLNEKGNGLCMENGTIDVFRTGAGTGGEETRVNRRGDDKAILCQTQPEKLGETLGLLAQHHPDGEDNEIERILDDFSPLRVDESNPQRIRNRSVIDLGGETSNQADPFVLTTRIEELLKKCSCRLDIGVEKGGLDVRILVTDRFDQAERIGATNLRAVKVSYGFVPTPHALKERYAFWKFSIRRAGEDPAKTKHFIKIFGRDDILESAVPVFHLPRGIERIDSCSDDNRRNLQVDFFLSPL